jgi:glycosyltransferase involved in cell wall biosynthesis
MKILFCPAHYQFSDKDGSEYNSCFQIVDGLGQKYSDSVVVTGKNKISDEKAYTIISTCDNVDISLIGAIIFNIRFTIKGWLLLRKTKFDAIHHVRPFLIGATFNILPFLPKNKNVPFIVGPFCSPYSEEDHIISNRKVTLRNRFELTLSKLIKPIINYLSFRTLARADAILVNDERTRSLVYNMISSQTIHVVPVGKEKDKYFFDSHKYSSSENEKTPTNILLVPDGKYKEDYTLDINKYDSTEIIIFAAGQLIPRKSFDVALRAFAVALKSNPHLRLKIAGDGEEMASLQRLAKDLLIDDKVTFLGWVPYQEMSKHYSTSHIFLHTAYEEAFGHVYIEALASGLPIVSTDTIGAREIIIPGVGLIAPKNDWKKLAEEIVAITSDYNSLVATSKAARQHFENNYDIQSVINNCLEAYRAAFNKVNQNCDEA